MDALTPTQREQLRLPLREGGLGFRAQASLREAAYLGSWLGNLEAVRARRPEGTASKERFLHEDRDWARALANAQAALAARGVHLDDQGEVAPRPPRGLRHPPASVSRARKHAMELGFYRIPWRMVVKDHY